MTGIRTILWGVFLACSWTWCIGMYLPLIMFRQWGWIGVIAFAIPNVLGCVRFGYLYNTERSRTAIDAHGPAMVAFSLVTVAFHLFFVTFLFMEAAQVGPTLRNWLPLVGAIGLYVVGLGLSRLGSVPWLVAAVLTYALSVAAALTVGIDGLQPNHIAGWNYPQNLLLLTPILFFGFLLCPSLDLTFHRARRESPSRHSFVYFGAAFAPMLLLTILVWNDPDSVTPRAIAIAHILAQSAFTVGAHLREMRECSAIRSDAARATLTIVPLLGIAVLPIASAIDRGALGLGEDLYIRFFVFYGLVFPAYALVFMGRSRLASPTWGGIAALAVAIVCAAPMFELAFFHERWLLLLVPATMIVAWLVFGGRLGRAGPPRSA